MIHARFLLFLLLFVLCAFSVEPFLPHWMTEEVISGRRGKSSVADILFVVSLAAFLLVERFVISLKIETKDSDLENKLL